MAHLSTHVLDTSRGKPAAGVKIELFHEGKLAHATVTNQDGRTDTPFPSVAVGVYEFIFHAGAYFREVGTPLSEPPFLDEIVIRFGVADPHGRYHVPLLLSPYGYSTYRGS